MSQPIMSQTEWDALTPGERAIITQQAQLLAQQNQQAVNQQIRSRNAKITTRRVLEWVFLVWVLVSFGLFMLYLAIT